MRIKGFDLQQPVVGIAVAVQKIQAMRKDLNRGEVLFLADEFAVDHMRAVLGHIVHELQLMGVIFLAQAVPRRLDHGLPRIAFLTAHEFEGGITGVIGGAAILEIMIVIGDQMRMHIPRFQRFGKGIVERLKRTPAAMQKRQMPGQHVAPRRHAGHRADIMAVIDPRPRRQPVEIRRRNAGAAIGRQHVTVQRIEQDKDGFHGRPAVLGAS